MIRFAQRASCVSIAAAGLLAFALVVDASQESPAAALVKRTLTNQRGRAGYLAEELFIRDVYARLTRYQTAAVEMRDEARGSGSDPYLKIGLSDIRTEAGSTALGKRASGQALRLLRQERCHAEDPCHAYYEVGWRTPPPSRPRRNNWSGPIVAHTRYHVRIRFGGQELEYDAVALYHQLDLEWAAAEIVDPVIPGINEVAADWSPVPRSPWNEYVRSARYRRAIDEAVGATATKGASRRSSPRPIGYLPGDSVEQEMAIMSAGIPCEPACGDQRDTAIAEYRDAGLEWVPQCSDFQAAGGNGRFSWADYTNHERNTIKPWAILAVPSTFDDLQRAEVDVRTNLLLAGYQFTETNILNMTSGYRTVSGNIAQTGRARSEHVRGDAVDSKTKDGIVPWCQFVQEAIGDACVVRGFNFRESWEEAGGQNAHCDYRIMHWQ